MTEKKPSQRALYKKFIILYRAAVKAGLSREQFAKYIGMQPQSVARKRLKVKEKYGTDLTVLEQTGEENIPKELKDKFETLYNMMFSEIGKSKKPIKRSNNKATYVITSAQNATPVFENFLSSIKKFISYNNAELMVIPYRYKNPTSVWTEKDHDWWHPSLQEYITDEHIHLCEGMRVMGHIKMQPTASHPLSGFDSYTNTDSGIFGHPKVQLKTIPTPNMKMPKILTTTGSITLPNYTDSTAGHKGEFHHSASAVIVEVDDGEFHIRHIHADEDGTFYDLDKKYSSNGIETGQTIEALITGDTHVEFIDKSVDEATYTNVDSIVNILKPKHLIYHDIHDAYARNHHHKGNDILAVGKHRYGRNNVEQELQLSADFIDRNSRPWMTNVIVKSNHDEALDKWLRETDPKQDSENSQFYYYMKYHQLKNIKKTPTGFMSIDPFSFWCNNPESLTGLKSKNNTVFLKRKDSYMIKDIELGFHGDAGPNGSRGTVNSLSKIGTKIIIGHSHSPGINEGAYQVGLSARLDLEYTRGPSSWLHTHAIVYPNGARTLINIINGKWRKA
jgi:hypothetical protein